MRSVLANGVSANNLLGMRQEIIVVISQKSKQTSVRKSSNFTVDRDHSYKK